MKIIGEYLSFMYITEPMTTLEMAESFAMNGEISKEQKDIACELIEIDTENAILAKGAFSIASEPVILDAGEGLVKLVLGDDMKFLAIGDFEDTLQIIKMGRQ